MPVIPDGPYISSCPLEVMHLKMTESGMESLHLGRRDTHGYHRVRRTGLHWVLSGQDYVDRGTRELKRLERVLRQDGSDTKKCWSPG